MPALPRSYYLLFGAALVPDEVVTQAIEKRNMTSIEDFMLASLEPPKKEISAV